MNFIINPIIGLLSYGLTITLSFPTLVTLFVVTLLTIWYVIRYRYLNAYTKLQDPTPTVPLKLPPTTTVLEQDEYIEEGAYPAAGNGGGGGEFLGAFLSSIKVFGYLERPVFHELARHLEVRELAAGEILNTDEVDAFYIVVQGCVQVLARPLEKSEWRKSMLAPGGGDMGGASREGTMGGEEDWWDYDNFEQKYLLNEVKDGGTLSSLFNILALFADQDHQHSSKCDQVKEDGSTGAVFPSMLNPASPLLLETKQNCKVGRKVLHGEVVYRASRDTTLAVVPGEAFRRVTEKFPAASAHIVQVILTRFQRVTFRTLHQYLGLGKELLMMERKINQLASCPEPLFKTLFPKDVLDRLRMRFMGIDWVKQRCLDSEEEEEVENENVSSLAGISTMDMLGIAESDTGGLTGSRSAKRRTTVSKRSLPQRWINTQVQQQVPNHNSHLKNLVSSATSSGIGGNSTNRKKAKEPTDAAGGGGKLVTGPDAVFLRKAAFRAFKVSVGIDPPELPSLVAEGGGGGGYSSDESIATTTTTASTLGYAKGQLRRSVDELESEVKILFFPKNTTLLRENEHHSGLFLVIDGLLDACVQASKRKKSVSAIRPGGVAGFLTAFTGAPTLVSLRAGHDTVVAHFPKALLDKIVERRPGVLMTLAKWLVKQMSPLVLHIDYALEWLQVKAGQVLYHQGDKSESIQIVLNGRLRAVRAETGQVVGEYGQGDSVGELEVLTDMVRPVTLQAIRDTEIANMSKTFFNALAMRHPEITMQISRIVASRSFSASASLHRGVTTQVGGMNSPLSHVHSLKQQQPESGHVSSLRTVALIPGGGGVDVTTLMDVAERLAEAIGLIGESCKLIEATTVTQQLGRYAFTRIGKLKLAHWLAEMEEEFRVVLYVADATPGSLWTQRCIRQADCVLTVAISSSYSTMLSEHERVMQAMKTTARKELVLLHRERSVTPGSTFNWLKERPWIHSHHNLLYHSATSTRAATPHPRRNNPHRSSKLLFSLTDGLVNIYRDKFGGGTSNSSGNTTSVNQRGPRSDFARLARRLCGRAIGLVLGGGGARGISQIGVIKALEDFGIPIDVVGGTSIGSFVGGLYARQGSFITTYPHAKSFSARMSSTWRLILDLTYPVTSWFTGHEFNRGIWKAFRDHRIEDSWLPFYCNTTNITWRRMDFHHTGYAWRFIRASMSLSGFLPPVCHHGDMLLDGGYTDNLTVEHMISLPGISQVIAVDVGRVDDTSPINFGDSVNGFWLLVQSWNPLRNYALVPSLADIQSRLMYVLCYSKLCQAKVTPGCLYLQPPVQEYEVMDFYKFDELYQLGYRYGRQVCLAWRKDGTLAKLTSDYQQAPPSLQRFSFEVRQQQQQRMDSDSDTANHSTAADFRRERRVSL